MARRFIQSFKLLRSHITQLGKQRQRYEQYSEFSTLPLIPAGEGVGGVMKPWKLRGILKESTRGKEEGELRACSSVELEQESVYNRDGEEVVKRMKEVERELQTCILQGMIRRWNAMYVFRSSAEGAITKVQRRKSRCCLPKRMPLPIMDYSVYFVESDWVLALSDVEKKSREEQWTLLQSLQIQLRKVEDRLVCNDKVGRVDSRL